MDETIRRDATHDGLRDESLSPVVERLTEKFADGNGPLDDEVVARVVQSAADDLSDAPVQAFAPVIAENKARKTLRRLAEQSHMDER